MTILIKTSAGPTPLSKELLGSLLQKANLEAKEKGFDLTEIIESIFQYLDIFLIDKSELISSDKLSALIKRVLEENDYPKTAIAFKLSLEESGSNECYDQQLQNYCNHKTPESIIKKIAALGPEMISEKIATLISSKAYIPSANILSKQQIDTQSFIIKDDLKEIFNVLNTLALNIQNGISSICDFSNLRPRNSVIETTQSFSSGPISFMKIYFSAFDALKNGATKHHDLTQTYVLNIDHPDILEYLLFIKANSNLSNNKSIFYRLNLTQDFLNACKENDDFALINPKTKETSNLLDANNTLDLIFETIKANPQLGLTIDHEIHNESSQRSYLNLSTFIKDQKFDFDSLAKALSDLGSFFESIRGKQKMQIGLTGLAELFIKLQIGYATVKAIELTSVILDFIAKNAPQNTEFIVEHSEAVSKLTGLTPGIEPLQYLAQAKSSIDGETKYHLNPSALELDSSLQNTEDIQRVSDFNSLHFLELDDQIKTVYATKKDISLEFSLQIQLLFERYFDYVVKDHHLPSNAQIKILLDQSLKNLLLTHFDNVESKSVDSNKDNSPNYLIKINQQRKSTTQIQPALFQIKKTEEITLPPITTDEL